MDDYHFGAYQGADAQGIANFGRPTGIPRFYTRSVPDLVASREKGMPISKAVDFIEILTPGERDTVDREVKPSDKFQWAREWAAYKEGREAAPEGTPLSQLFLTNPEIVESLRALRFHTVEQLAEAPDSALQAIPMGAHEWQRKAQRFLEGSKDAAKFAKLEQELAAERHKRAELEKKVDALLAATAKEPAEPEPAPVRRRG